MLLNDDWLLVPEHDERVVADVLVVTAVVDHDIDEVVVLDEIDETLMVQHDEVDEHEYVDIDDEADDEDILDEGLQRIDDELVLDIVDVMQLDIDEVVDEEELLTVGVDVSE